MTRLGLLARSRMARSIRVNGLRRLADQIARILQALPRKVLKVRGDGTNRTLDRLRRLPDALQRRAGLRRQPLAVGTVHQALTELISVWTWLDATFRLALVSSTFVMMSLMSSRRELMLSATPRTESAAAAILLVAEETSLTARLIVDALTAPRSVSMRARVPLRPSNAPFSVCSIVSAPATTDPTRPDWAFSASVKPLTLLIVERT